MWYDMGKSSSETIYRAELSMGNTSLILKAFFYRRIRPGGTIPLCIFHMIFISIIEVIRVLKNLPHCVLRSTPSCALLSHSDRTLPRHIWFLARLITTNNVHTVLRIPLGPHSYVQILHQVTAVSRKERRDYCTAWLQDGKLMTQRYRWVR